MGTFRTIVGVLQSCPSCGWGHSRPSARRGMRDYVVACLFLAPHRCLMCRTRFFRFSIPYRIAAKPDVKAAAVLIDTPSPSPDPLPAPHPSPAPVAEPLIPASSVLLVSGDLPVRKLLRRILERDGYRIQELSEPAQIGPELQAHPADLVIADLDLSPEQTIRTLEPVLASPDPRVIVLSSVPMAANGAFRSCIVLEKPFRGETLLSNVRSALCATSLKTEPILEGIDPGLLLS